MAILDERNRVVVLRIVYAGPPLSGKTETVRSLCTQLLSSRQPGEVYTPDEAGSRTLFFDWLEYAGGTFHGRTIRCQIVAVPGQSMLYRRRQMLLQSADAVVFVVDSRPEHAEAISASYQEMRRFIDKAGESSPVGVIVQANKSDLPDAMPKDTLRELLGTDPTVSIVPTVATQGTGLRETFVQAVGIALERVRALMDADQLIPAAGPVSIETGEELLQQIKALEDAELGEVQRVVVEILNSIDMPLPAPVGAEPSALEESSLPDPEPQLAPILPATVLSSQQMPDLAPAGDFAAPVAPPAAVFDADPEPDFVPEPAPVLTPIPAPDVHAEPAAVADAEPAPAFAAEPAPAVAAEEAPPSAPELPAATDAPPVTPDGTAGSSADADLAAQPPQDTWIAFEPDTDPAAAAADIPPAAQDVPQDTWEDAQPAMAAERNTHAGHLPKDAWAAVAAPLIDGSFAPVLAAADPAPPVLEPPPSAWAVAGAADLNVTGAPAASAPEAPVNLQLPKDAWVAVDVPPPQGGWGPPQGADSEGTLAAPTPVAVHPPRGAWAAVHVHPPRGAWAAVVPTQSTPNTAASHSASARLGTHELPQSAPALADPPTIPPKEMEGLAARLSVVLQPEAHGPAPVPDVQAATDPPSPAATRQAAPHAGPRTAPHSGPQAAVQAAARTPAPQTAPVPVTPDKRVGAGMVWPPIAGRHVLNALSGGQPRLRQLPNQAWIGESGRWLLLSLPEHAFSSEVLAREEMLRLARSHSLLKPVLTEQRCVSCTMNWGSEWRIWQVVRRETTLADVLQLMHALPTAESIVTELLRIAYLLGVALARFRAASLFCAPTLDKIAVSQGGPVYSGFVLPNDTHAGNGSSESLGAAALIRRELQGAITALARRLELMPQLLRQLEANKRSAPPGDRVAETLIAMFLHTDTRT